MLKEHLSLSSLHRIQNDTLRKKGFHWRNPDFVVRSISDWINEDILKDLLWAGTIPFPVL